MLMFLRESVQGWVGKILLALLVISFAVWGVSSSLLSGAGNSVITAGQTSISANEYLLAYEGQRNAIERQFNRRFTRDEARVFGIESRTLAQLANDALIGENAREAGIGISDDKLASFIGKEKAFHGADGRFDRNRFSHILSNLRMNESDYIASVKKSAIRSQIIDTIGGNMQMPQAYYDIVTAAESEKRVFEYFKVTPQMIAPVSEPDEAAIKQYYDANLSRYRAPEYRKVDLLKLEAADIADEAAVTKEELEAAYESGKNTYTTVEKRKIEQILFTSEKEAKAALAKIRAGGTFEQALSDAGKTLEAATLGTLAKEEVPDPAVAQTAFSLSQGQISDIVKGLFGSILLRVSEIQPETTKPQSEVEGELRKTLALEKAANEIYEMHDRVEDERIAGQSLEETAKTLGVKNRLIEALDNQGKDKKGKAIADLPNAAKLLGEIFSTDIGVETFPIALGTTGFVWFEVLDIIADRQKTLDEVRPQVIADWKQAETEKAVAALAEKMHKRIEAGEDFAAVIADSVTKNEDGSDRVLTTTEPLNRNSAGANGNKSELDAPVIQSGFALASGEVGIVSPLRKTDEKILLRVKSVTEGKSSAPEEQLSDAGNAALADDVLGQYLGGLRRDYALSINHGAINSILTQNRR